MVVTDSLPINPRASVRREPGRAWIDGLRPLAWRSGRDCTFAGALESALCVTEHPFGYDDLMGFSGLAFRVRWCNPSTGGWDLTCACGEYPEEYSALIRATGWTLPVELLDVQEVGADAAVGLPRIVANIDAGWPILAPVADHDIGLIAGYEDGGAAVLAYRYNASHEMGRYPLSAANRFRIYLGDRSAEHSPTEGFLDSLTTAVRNWRRERGDGGLPGRDFYYGEAAIRAWIGDLEKADPRTMAANDLRLLHEVNHFAFLTLVDARSAAARYLTGGADLLAAGQLDAVRQAAALYETESAHLAMALQDGTVPNPREAAAQPPSRWSPGQRAVQRSLLQQAVATERRAISALGSVAGA